MTIIATILVLTVMMTGTSFAKYQSRHMGTSHHTSYRTHKAY